MRTDFYRFDDVECVGALCLTLLGHCIPHLWCRNENQASVWAGESAPETWDHSVLSNRSNRNLGGETLPHFVPLVISIDYATVWGIAWSHLQSLLHLTQTCAARPLSLLSCCCWLSENSWWLQLSLDSELEKNGSSECVLNQSCCCSFQSFQSWLFSRASIHQTTAQDS